MQRGQANTAFPTRPQYLLLSEAESYDSFMLLAHAFRQWRGHAATEQLPRYAARRLVRLQPNTVTSAWNPFYCAVHAVSACN